MFGFLTHMVGSLIPRMAILFGVDLGIHALGACHAMKQKTEHYFDITGTSTFLLLTGLSMYLGKWSQAHDLQHGRLLIALPSIIVGLWAVRLGAYLFARVKLRGFDERFDVAKRDRTVMAMFWMMHALWVFATLLPVMCVNLNSEYIDAKKKDFLHDLHENPRRASVFGLGAVLAVCGLILETVADIQKANFKMNPNNNGKFINVGLWHYLRYPNYSGEIQLWIGQYLMCAAIINTMFSSLLFLVSPVFVTTMLINLTGIAVQEKQQKEAWGANPAFQAYHRKTKMLIPGVY